MNVHEYQAKEILAKSGVSVQRGIPASDKDQAVNAAVKLTEETGTKIQVMTCVKTPCSGTRCQIPNHVCSDDIILD